MLRLWAKTIKDQKITQGYIYESIDNFSADTFYLHVANICHKMDIATPVVLKTHVQNLVTFNNVTFLPRDFVESVNFDKFTIEDASL